MPPPYHHHTYSTSTGATNPYTTGGSTARPSPATMNMNMHTGTNPTPYTSSGSGSGSSSATSMSATKTRQYAQLHASLAQLNANLSDTQNLVRMTAVQAEDMRFLGGYVGALFMGSAKVLGEEGVKGKGQGQGQGEGVEFGDGEGLGRVKREES